MSTNTPVAASRRDNAVIADRSGRRHLETKPAYKTTEFIMYLVAVAGVLIASAVVDGNGNGDNGSGGDYFRADRAWLYVVLLTIGYMVSRGLAKAGSRDSSDS
jgi:hypothetical protein